MRACTGCVTALLVAAAAGCSSRILTEYVENRPLRSPVEVRDITAEGFLLLEDGRRVRPRLDDGERRQAIERFHRGLHRGRPCDLPLPPECADEVWGLLAKRNGEEWARWIEDDKAEMTSFAHPEFHAGRPCVPHAPAGCAPEIWKEYLRGQVLVLGTGRVDVENVSTSDDGVLEAEVFAEFDRTRMRLCGLGVATGYGLAPVKESVPRYVRRPLAGDGP